MIRSPLSLGQHRSGWSDSSAHPHTLRHTHTHTQHRKTKKSQHTKDQGKHIGTHSTKQKHWQTVFRRNAKVFLKSVFWLCEFCNKVFLDACSHHYTSRCMCVGWHGLVPTELLFFQLLFLWRSSSSSTPPLPHSPLQLRDLPVDAATRTATQLRFNPLVNFQWGGYISRSCCFFLPTCCRIQIHIRFFWDSQVSFRLRWINNGVAYKWVFPLEAMWEITNIGWLTFALLIRSVGTWFWARSMRRHFSNEEHKYWKRRLRPELWVKSVAPRAVALDYGSTQLADDVEMRSVPE